MKYILSLKLVNIYLLNLKLTKVWDKMDAIAHLLIDIVLEITIRKHKVETQRTTFDKCSQIMAYADDVVIMDIWLQDVEEVFTSLVDKTDKMGLEINDKKRKFLIISRKPYNKNEYIKLGTCNSEIVKDYLSWYTSNIQKWMKTRNWKKN